MDGSASSRARPGAIALALAALGLLVLLAAGPGTRYGLWHYRTGLGLLRHAVYLGGAGALVGLVAAATGRGRALGVAALVAGLATVAVPVQMQRTAKSVPIIHDVSTDPADPLLFESVRRAPTDNPLTAAPPDVVAEQRKGYPDLAPLVLSVAPRDAFARVEETARKLGWEVVAADAVRGRLEATDTTTWFGFKDDVVVRLRSEGNGTRVDVRSVSRVGRSDLGANAARIRRFLAALPR